MLFSVRTTIELLLLLGTGLAIGQRNHKNTNNKNCTTPPYPNNGHYVNQNGTKLPEGTEVIQNSVLFYKCDQGYIINKKKPMSYCLQGKWTSKIKCDQVCRNLTSTTVDYACSINGKNVTCQHMKNGTTAIPACKSRHFENPHSKLKTLKCINEKWNDTETDCVAECGEEVTKSTAYIFSGYKANKGTSPWHVGIYDNKTGDHKYICGGTIITNKIVISAAHCFDRGSVGNISPASEYCVAAGKRYRKWDEREETEQKFGILKIVTNKRFSGFSTYLANDIAILILDKLIDFNDFVHPACLDRTDVEFKNAQIATNKTGQVAGWGLIDEKDQNTLSDVLLIANLPIIDYETCKEKMSPQFHKFLGNDKLCAGYLNGTTVCKGDSGGGLVFPFNDSGITRFYLRAIVSVGDFDDTGATCNKNAYVAFTDVWSQNELIDEGFKIAHESNINYFDKNSCLTPSYLYNITYRINGIEKPEGFNSAQFSAAEYSCNFGNATNIENYVSICVRGKWKPEIKCSEAREEAKIDNPVVQELFVIPPEYTASELDEEYRVAYWREDIGANLHNWHWNLVYPFNSNNRTIVDKNRHGELFYYMHEQIQARYNFERLANMLPRVKKFNNFREPIKEAYYPNLDTYFSSNHWASRSENMVIRDLNLPRDGIVMTVNDFETYIRRLFDAIHSGIVMDTNGQNITLDEETGIDILGNLIESSMLSINSDYYGNVHNFGHLFLGFIHSPVGKHLDHFGVIADPATELRDPIFYRLHAFIDDMFQEYKATIPRYNRSSLENPNIRLTHVVVDVEGGQLDIFETFWMKSDFNLSRGLDFVSKISNIVRYTHLNHKPFTYRLTVENSGPAKMGTIRIFLAPKYDEKGLPWKFREQRLMFIELDKFFVQLRSGSNQIERRSVESSVTVPFERTFRNLEEGREEVDEYTFNFCGCGWPQYLLIPKGTEAGMACELFVMVSNYDYDYVEQTPGGSCSDAPSYCGIKDKLWPDKRSMGYPFDRFPNDDNGTVEDFLTPNMVLKDVTVRFRNTTVINPRNTRP